jgi:hypothetical protein
MYAVRAVVAMVVETVTEVVAVCGGGNYRRGSGVGVCS